MKVTQMLDNLAFHEPMPYAQPILVDQYARILRWMLKAGQHIEEHKVPDSPFYVLVLQGRGIFTGQDGSGDEVGAGTLLVFEPGETHSVTALDEDLIFVSFLKSVEGMRVDRVGGEIAHQDE